MAGESPPTRARSRSPAQAPDSPTARADRAPRGRRRSRSPLPSHTSEAIERGRSRSPPSTYQVDTSEHAQSQDDSTLKTRLRQSEERFSSPHREAEEDRRSGEADPPLPKEPTEAQAQDTGDDGWEPHWSQEHGAWWFYNRFTQVTQWENPRVSTSDQASAAAVPPRTGAAGTYNPRIHGNWDPNADYAKAAAEVEEPGAAGPNSYPAPGADEYAVSASFNRFNGSFYNPDVHPNRNPNAHTADAQAQRQLLAFMPANEAADQHGGVSLKEQRRNQKLSKGELQYYKQRDKEKRAQKQRQKWANIG